MVALFLLCDCKKEVGSLYWWRIACWGYFSKECEVGIAVGSKDHTTLLVAVKAADQVIGMAI